MKLKKFLPLLVLTFASCSSNGTLGEQAVDYNPSKDQTNDQFNFEGNYTPPELTIDGIKDEEQWNSASEELIFGSQNQCKMVMYRGDHALFCFFDVSDIDIQTVGNNNGDDVTAGDSVEVYFDFKNDAASKPQTDDIQINIGAHGKTRIFVGSNGQWGAWNGLLDYEIKLNGTLNNDTDTDQGYTVELMVPYAQVGIDKNSTFGVAVGHVARGKDSTHETLQYTWGGLVFEGSFVDPQSPKAYVVSLGNDFYSRSNLPVGNVTVNGTIYDENNQPLEGVKVKIDNQETTSDKDGKYTFNSISGDKNQTIELSKDGYKSYSRNITTQELRSDLGRFDLNLCLIKVGSTKTTKIKGYVKNPVIGLVENAKLTVGEKSTFTNSDGYFELDILIDNNLEVILTKDNYKESVSTLNTLDLIKNTSVDVGTLSLYSPSSNATFGGARGITKAEVEIYRGFNGVNFLFKTNTKISNGDRIETFIDSGKSASIRDTSDYRIDFDGDGGFSITNFGNGSNNIPSKSQITNNAYLKGSTYYIEAMIPYSFLGVKETDIIGVSFGVYSESLKDWDGWDFNGYVAPEYPNQYCRIGLDNGLYRASSNEVKVTKIYGSVTDTNGNPISTATVNGTQVNSDGSYSLYLQNKTASDITISAPGYLTQTITLSSDDLTGEALKKDITLYLAEAIIQGSCNVNGAKVYLESDPTIFTYVSNNSYSIKVPTNSNAFLIFEADGYTNLRKGFGVASLVGSASNNLPITFDATLTLA